MGTATQPGNSSSASGGSRPGAGTVRSGGAASSAGRSWELRRGGGLEGRVTEGLGLVAAMTGGLMVLGLLPKT